MEKIGAMLNIGSEELEDWISLSPVSQVVNEDGESVNLLTSMLVNDLGTRQEILSCLNATDAVEEIMKHFSDFLEAQSS